jgi:hypothetical protein
MKWRHQETKERREKDREGGSVKKPTTTSSSSTPKPAPKPPSLLSCPAPASASPSANGLNNGDLVTSAAEAALRLPPVVQVPVDETPLNYATKPSDRRASPSLPSSPPQNRPTSNSSASSSSSASDGYYADGTMYLMSLDGREPC